MLIIFVILLGLREAWCADIVTTPYLSRPTLIRDGRDFIQTCSFNFHGSDPNAEFTVMWLFDNQVVKTVTLKNATTTDSIHADDWVGHVGKKISCSVVYNGGQPKKSNGFLGEVKVSMVKSYLQEGEVEPVTVTSTLPVVCPHLPPQLCELELHFDAQGDPAGLLVPADSCSVILKATDWDPRTWKVTATSSVAGVIDPAKKPNLHYQLSYTEVSNVLLHSMWEKVRTIEQPLTLMDGTTKVCMHLGQYHTFTATRHRLRTQYQHGDYNLFNGESDNGDIFKVQLRNDIHNNAELICGAAIQYKDALVIVNLCASMIEGRRIAPLVTQGAQRPDYIRVYECDSEFEIVTADGIQITISVQDYHLELKLHIPSFYKFNTGGLCMHTVTETLTGALANSYRLNDNESLFLKGGDQFHQNQTSQNATKFCDCQGQNCSCDSFGRVRNPLSPIVRENHCERIEPHSYDPLLERFNFTASAAKPLPSHNSRLATACRTHMTEQMPSFCSQLLSYERTSLITGCTEEGTYKYSMANHGYKWACEENLISSYNTYTKDGNGDLVAPWWGTLSVPSSVTVGAPVCLATACVDLPATQGNTAIVMDIYQHCMLEELEVFSGSVCDILDTACYDPVIFAYSFPDGPLLKAQVQLLQFEKGKFSPSPLLFHVNGTFESMYSVSVSLHEIMKTLPGNAAVGFMISITVDGNTYSNPLYYYIVDSNCQRCENVVLGTATCYQREDRCLIGRQCYEFNDVNPNNSSQICDPDKRLLNWTSV